MPSRSLPCHPGASTPRGMEPVADIRRHWHWRAMLAAMAALLAAVVMAQAIVQIRSEQAAPIQDSATAAAVAVPEVDASAALTPPPAVPEPTQPASATPATWSFTSWGCDHAKGVTRQILIRPERS